MSTPKGDLLLFFDRPTEPCFMLKGEEQAAFELPDNYYVSYHYSKVTLKSTSSTNWNYKSSEVQIPYPEVDYTIL